MCNQIIMNMNGIHFALKFLEWTISICPDNFALKVHVTGSGNGFLKRALIRTIP